MPFKKSKVTRFGFLAASKRDLLTLLCFKISAPLVS